MRSIITLIILLGCIKAFGCGVKDKKPPPDFSYYGKWESILDYEEVGFVYSYLELKEDGSGISFKVSSKGKVYYLVEFKKSELIKKGNHLEIQLKKADLGHKNKLTIMYHSNNKISIYRLYSEAEPERYRPRNPGSYLEKVSEKSAFVQSYLNKYMNQIRPKKASLVM